VNTETIRSTDLEIGETLRSLPPVEPPPALTERILVELGLADQYFESETPFGRTYFAFNELGVSMVERGLDHRSFEQEFRSRHGRAAVFTDSPPRKLVRQIESRLRGLPSQGPAFDLRELTDFERDVLLKTLEIPFGQVRPYGWVAAQIGRPRAMRAVGSALADNPVPLLIPCHRVVRSDGRIGNYGLGGPAAKRRFLELEGVEPDQLETLARRNVRYFGSDTTHIYCYPTCGHARRVTDRHRVAFSSARQALSNGYRPCKVCRPVAG